MEDCLRNTHIDTYQDFVKILENELLMFNGTIFEWQKIDVSNGKIVGYISTCQESCPVVDIEICLVKDNKIIYKYCSHAKNEYYCYICWYDEKDDVYYGVDFYKDTIMVAKNGCNKNPYFNVVEILASNDLPAKIEIHDECLMIPKEYITHH